MNLTREHAIAEFRKEWNHIADEIEKIKTLIDVEDYKFEYCYKNKFYIKNDCFLCEYTCEGSSHVKCEKCPIKWEGDYKGFPCEGESWNEDETKYGLWWKCQKAKTWQEQAALARQIANLPEREDV